MPRELFDEFEGEKEHGMTSGDVKYHMGFSADIETSHGNKVHLSLMPNPSHLETVNPVVEGFPGTPIEESVIGIESEGLPVSPRGEGRKGGFCRISGINNI